MHYPQILRFYFYVYILIIFLSTEGKKLPHSSANCSICSILLQRKMLLAEAGSQPYPRFDIDRRRGN
ncbi:hypothetical protein BN77_1513 [Rhizobium mesoamericanum STM3625]|uniref:Uncharacterized protein n=1 Tax=Rhizobium mesoamericanum STM3625 TaxID=1211777 RepID=K0PTA3_9HYPH|nr:hypothetical protein BN77_1513 [Rhizobium mesoamericanum STM3625]